MPICGSGLNCQRWSDDRQGEPLGSDTTTPGRQWLNCGEAAKAMHRRV